MSKNHSDQRERTKKRKEGSWNNETGKQEAANELKEEHAGRSVGWGYIGGSRKDYESIVITRLVFLRLYPVARILHTREQATTYERKHAFASPPARYLRTFAYDVRISIFLSLLCHSCSRCVYYLKARIFSDYPPSFSSLGCSQLIPHNKRKPGLGRHRSRMGAHAYIRARARVTTLVSSFLAKWPSPALACLPRSRPRTPSTANLSLDSIHRQPYVSHFSPSTKHAQSCGIKTQAAAHAEEQRTLARSRASRFPTVSRPVCSRQDFGEHTDYRFFAFNFNFLSLIVPLSFARVPFRITCRSFWQIFGCHSFGSDFFQYRSTLYLLNIIIRPQTLQFANEAIYEK